MALNVAGIQTRQTIVWAAIGEACRSGIDAWSIRDVAARTGTNLNAINYHFGSKSRLLDEMVQAAGQLLLLHRERRLTALNPDRLSGPVFLGAWFGPLLESVAMAAQSGIAQACRFLGQARVNPKGEFLRAMAAHEQQISVAAERAMTIAWPTLGLSTLQARFRMVNAAAWDLAAQPGLRTSIRRSDSPRRAAQRLLEDFVEFSNAGMSAPRRRKETADDA